MRYIQDPETNELVPAHEYTKPRQFRRHNHNIIGDIDSFVSPVDGSLITGRAALKAHNKRNNVTNTADFSSDWCEAERKRIDFKRGKADKAERIEAIKNAIDNPTPRKTP